MPEPPATRTPGAIAPVPEPVAGPAGFAVTRLATVDSTNRYALDTGRGGAPDRTVVVADAQSAGRGRLGRTWIAPPGSSLLVSVLLRPAAPVERLGRLTMAAALAMADAVTAVAAVAPELKWPNDLLVDGRKLAGILAEAEPAAGGAPDGWIVVIGIGVNVAWDSFPPEIAEQATSLAAVSDAAVTRDALLDAFLVRLGPRLDALDAVPGEYRARLGTLGRAVRVELARETFEGVASAVDDDGRLNVTRSDGSVTAVGAGDVVHLRTT